MESSDTQNDYETQFELPSGNIKESKLESPPIVAGSYVTVTYRNSAELYNEKVDFQNTKGNISEKYKTT